jgi:ElaB/YqjD/DUF883 family membrane-anchored ribosome-binding protein
MASKRKHSASARDADPAEPQDETETPDRHVETAEEIYRSAADIGEPIASPAQRAYGLTADAVYEAGLRLARHPWATLAAGAVTGCLAGVLFRSRR